MNLFTWTLVLLFSFFPFFSSNFFFSVLYKTHKVRVNIPVLQRNATVLYPMICQYLKWREIHVTFVVCTGFYECTRMERSDLWVGLLARDVPWAYELRRKAHILRRKQLARNIVEIATKKKIKEAKSKERKRILEEKIALRNKVKEERLQERLRKEKLKEYKRVEKDKIRLLREQLRAVDDRLVKIREKYQLIKQKRREQKLAELEIRRQTKEEARKIFEAQKAENLLKQKVVERLERYSRNMKSIVFQINKRYLALRRAPLRFVDHIAENGECFIKNEDAVSEEDYLILLFIEGETAKERLRKKITLEDRTDLAETKIFKPKNVFEASDYMIDRLARMFEKERQLKKAS